MTQTIVQTKELLTMMTIHPDDTCKNLYPLLPETTFCNKLAIPSAPPITPGEIEEYCGRNKEKNNKDQLRENSTTTSPHVRPSEIMNKIYEIANAEQLNEFDIDKTRLFPNEISIQKKSWITHITNTIESFLPHSKPLATTKDVEQAVVAFFSTLQTHYPHIQYPEIPLVAIARNCKNLQFSTHHLTAISKSIGKLIQRSHKRIDEINFLDMLPQDIILTNILSKLEEKDKKAVALCSHSHNSYVNTLMIHRAASGYMSDMRQLIKKFDILRKETEKKALLHDFFSRCDDQAYKLFFRSITATKKFEVFQYLPSSVKNLTIEDSSEISIRHLEQIARCCPQLSTICLLYCKIPPNVVLTIFKDQTKQILSFSYTPHPGTRSFFTSSMSPSVQIRESFDKAYTRTKNLLSQVAKATMNRLSPYVGSFPLRFLVTPLSVRFSAYMHKITKIYTSLLDLQNVQKIQAFEKLTHVEFLDVGFVSQTMIDNIHKWYPHLSTLILRNIHQMDITPLSLCAKLKTLHIHSKYAISCKNGFPYLQSLTIDAHIEGSSDFIKTCPKLEELHLLHSLGDSDIRNLVHCLPSLHSLDIRMDETTSKKNDFSLLSDIALAIPSLTSLTCSPIDFSKEISRIEIDSLSKLQCLRFLKLKGNGNATWSVTQALELLISLPQLESCFLKGTMYVQLAECRFSQPNKMRKLALSKGMELSCSAKEHVKQLSNLEELEISQESYLEYLDAPHFPYKRGIQKFICSDETPFQIQPKCLISNKNCRDITYLDISKIRPENIKYLFWVFWSYRDQSSPEDILREVSKLKNLRVFKHSLLLSEEHKEFLYRSIGRDLIIKTKRL